MSEVDHDAIAKQLIDAQKQGRLEHILKDNLAISEQTILALSTHLTNAIHSDLTQAKCIYELQVSVAKKINSQLAEGYLLCQLGVLKINTASLAEALEIFEKVRSEYICHFENYYTLSVYANILSIHVSLGEVEKAESLIKVIREHQKIVGDKGLSALARTEGTLGILYHNVGNLELATKAYNKAAALFKQIGDDTFRLHIQSNLASLLREQGEIAHSLKLFKQVRGGYKRLGLTSLIANSNMNIAVIEARRGRLLEASCILQSARELFIRIALFNKVAEVDIFYTLLYLQFRLSNEAYRSAISAQSLLTKHGGTFWDKCLVNLLIGQSLKYLGKKDESKKHLLLALDGYSEAGATQYASFATLVLADLDNLSLTDIQRIADITPRVESNIISTATRLSIANMMVGTDECDLAIEEIFRIFDTKETLSIEQDILAFHVLGSAYKKLDKLEKSKYWLQRSHLELDKVIRHLSSDELRTTLIASHSEIFRDLIDVSFKSALVNKSFMLELLEAVNASTSYLAITNTEANQCFNKHFEISNKLKSLRQRWYWHSHTGGAIWSLTDDGKEYSSFDNLEQARLEAEIIDASRQFNFQKENIAKDLLDAQIVKSNEPQEIQMSLPTDIAQIQYFLSDGYCHALLITREDIKLIDYIVPYQDVERLLRHWRFIVKNKHYFTANQSILELLHRLFNLLLKSISIPSGKAKLCISLPSTWHDLPVHAFYDGEKFLVEHKDVFFKLCPLFSSPTSRPYASVALIGDSSQGYLEAAVKEIDEIDIQLNLSGIKVRRNLGNLSLDYFEELVGDSDIVHIASHGSNRKDNALFALLHISEIPISALEVAQMKVKSNALVFLNACQSGLGSPVEDNVNGFSRSFLVAGAANVIACLWDVEDIFACKMACDFYETSLVNNKRKPYETLNDLQRKYIQHFVPILNWATYVLWQK